MPNSKIFFLTTIVFCTLLSCCVKEVEHNLMELDSNTTCKFAKSKNTESELTAKIGKMSIRKKIGQILMLDFRYWGKDEHGQFIHFTQINPDVKNIILNYGIGGIILYRENIVSIEQTVKLTDSFQKTAEIPLIIGTDQEGGKITCLQVGTDMPGNMSLGASNDYNLTREVARVMGRELKALGINLDFAPVLDVNSNQSNPVIGVRSFGSDPKLVSKMGDAYIKGLKDSSIISCAKHFPGHGDTQNDSHLGLAKVERDYRDLMNVDVLPFKNCTDSDAIMTAHIIVSALDDTKIFSKKLNKPIGVPATLSKIIVTDLLRHELNFKGVLFSDAMDMNAISDNFGNSDAVVMAIVAGINFILMPVRVWERADIKKLEELFVALEREYSKNSTFAKCVDASIYRIFKLKEKYNLLEKQPTCYLKIQQKIEEASKVVNCTKHKEVEKKASVSGITCLKNDNEILPFNLDNGSKILLLDSYEPRIKIIEDAIGKIKKDSKINFTFESLIYDPSSAITLKLQEAIAKNNLIILITYNLDMHATLPNQLLKFAKKEKKKCVVIAGGKPYDIAYLPDCSAYLAIYGTYEFNNKHGFIVGCPANMRSVLYAIFSQKNNFRNETTPKGRLPTNIISKKPGTILYKSGSCVNLLSKEIGCE